MSLDIQIDKQHKDTYQDILVKAGIQLSVSEYVIKYSAILLLGSIGTGALLGGITSIKYGISGFILGILLGVLFGLALIYLYPFLIKSIREEKINTTMPILITYMGGISTSKASRDQLFANVSERESSFGIAALEVRRIRVLATEWNFGYITAIQKVAQTTPSQRFGDFLSRFSQALDAGENLEVYFKKEQESVLNDFVSDYRRKLKTLETLNNAFIAISVSVSFMAVTFLIMMFLFGSDTAGSVRTLFMILGIMQMVNIAITLAFHSASPKDKLVSIQRKTGEYDKVFYAFMISVFIFMPIMAILSWVLQLDVPLFMIIFGISMLVPGRFSEDFEKLIERRDENFPVFIRTLGGTTALMGGSIFDSVRIISQEQFGPLTTDIQLLYAQAKFGIDPMIAWQWFGDSTSSNIIDRFLRIFTSSMDIGGRSDIIAQFISDNVEKILELRRDRHQVINTFKGTILPLTGINIATMVFMRDVLKLLYMVMTSLENFQGVSFGFGTPPPIQYTDIYFNIYFLTLPLYSALVLLIPQRGTWMKVTRYLSQYYIIIGLEIIIVAMLSQNVMEMYGVAFNYTTV